MSHAWFAAIPLFLILVAGSRPAKARQVNPIACDIPAVVVQLDPKTHGLDLVRDSPASDFTVALDGQSVKVNAAAVDTSPKRIVLTFDASKRVDKKQWSLQFQLADALLANSHSGDKFSVFLTPGSPSPFASAEETRIALQRLATARPSAEAKGNPMYDSLVLASKIFPTPQFGDSIVAIGFGKDTKSKNKPEYLLGTLIQRGIRLHTIDFAESGDTPFRTELATRGAITVANPDEAQLFAISGKSGGSSRAVRRDRSLKDDPAVQHRLQVLYEGIAQPYRLTVQLDGGGKPRKLEVSSAREKRPGPTIILSHPKVFVECPNLVAHP